MYYESKTGCIEVICGSMFSGKTEELISACAAHLRKSNDSYFQTGSGHPLFRLEVVSHDAQKMEAKPSRTQRNTEYTRRCAGGGVMRRSFSPQALWMYAATCKQGIRVIVAGLDTDYLTTLRPNPALGSCEYAVFTPSA